MFKALYSQILDVGGKMDGFDVPFIFLRKYIYFFVNRGGGCVISCGEKGDILKADTKKKYL